MNPAHAAHPITTPLLGLLIAARLESPGFSCSRHTNLTGTSCTTTCQIRSV